MTRLHELLSETPTEEDTDHASLAGSLFGWATNDVATREAATKAAIRRRTLVRETMLECAKLVCEDCADPELTLCPCGEPEYYHHKRGDKNLGSMCRATKIHAALAESEKEEP